MQAYSRNELLEAERQIKSLLSKLYKVEPKLKPGSSQTVSGLWKLPCH